MNLSSKHLGLFKRKIARWKLCGNEVFCKSLRRFIWHDRIHAKAMWRMAQKTFDDEMLNNIFEFWG